MSISYTLICAAKREKHPSKRSTKIFFQHILDKFSINLEHSENSWMADFFCKRSVFFRVVENSHIFNILRYDYIGFLCYINPLFVPITLVPKKVCNLLRENHHSS